jgi:hypothetical protein
MNYEVWYLEQIKAVVEKNPFSRYTKKTNEELAKSIKISLKRQKVFPQNNWQFERKINFAILNRTTFSLKQIVNITKFFYRSLDEDFNEFHDEFKSHLYFYSKGYMKSEDYEKISYTQWFYSEFSKAHKEFNDNFKEQMESLKS